MRTNIGLGFYGNAQDEYNDAKAYCALIGDTTTTTELDQTYQKLRDYNTTANAAFDDAVDGKKTAAFTNSGVRSSMGAELHKLGRQSLTDPGNTHENEWLALLSQADKSIGTRDNEYRDIFKHVIENYLRFGMLDKADDLLEKDIKVYQYLDKLSPLSEDASPEDTVFCTFACIDYQFLGEIRLRRHKYKEAIPWFERSLSLTDRYRVQRKETCEAHEGLGIAYREIGQDSSSVDEFTKAVNTFIPKDDNAGRLVEFKANLEKAQKKVELNSSEPTRENASSVSAQPAAK
jgi:hypothetical protein